MHKKQILIIDNSTSYLNNLKQLFSEHNLTIISFSEIDLEKINNFDLIILSGGSKFPVIGNEKLLQKEFKLIKESKKPIFGICFGFEIIASAFGATLKRMELKEKGIINIEILQEDIIFKNLPNLEIYESHRWVVESTGEDLIALAKSKDGIEAIKHKERQI
ncbi:MAG: gamma-glutamyl-gamma-aminobutyrate hydrolase family protein, partial [Candidatus Taylorbacteria bacterium]|nr:gamma-glutamyl-gamma-aminobutyrate hydrolase family protein [Candidatus Taylorbacteria bacterium]